MIKIGNKIIGQGRPYVIAEFGVNYNHSLERAKEGIRKAAEAGADAIKFQTYTADELVVKGTPKFWDWEGDKKWETQYDAYKELGGFSYDNYPELIRCCEENNIEFLSTPFSIEAADKLDDLGMKAFKVASSDMSTLPFLRHIARLGKPILLSTGAATMEEIHEAVSTIKKEGNDQIIVLHCTLCYPTKPIDANLNLIKTLQEEFPDFLVGISDHTRGNFPSMVAGVMGAKVIEKHFTVDKTLPDSADHWLSLDPLELKDLCKSLDSIETLKGSSVKQIFDCELETRKYDKRSVVSKKHINIGTTITEDMITYKRPGTGIWPKDVDKVIGKVARENISEDTIIKLEMLRDS